MKPASTLATIANGAAVTANFRVPEGMYLAGVAFPASMTQATFTIKNAYDDSTFVPVVGATGLTCTSSTHYALSHHITDGLTYVNVTMPGNETGSKAVYLIWAPRT